MSTLAALEACKKVGEDYIRKHPEGVVLWCFIMPSGLTFEQVDGGVLLDTASGTPVIILMGNRAEGVEFVTLVPADVVAIRLRCEPTAQPKGAP